MSDVLVLAPRHTCRGGEVEIGSIRWSIGKFLSVGFPHLVPSLEAVGHQQVLR